jgi:hypothetical protein
MGKGNIGSQIKHTKERFLENRLVKLGQVFSQVARHCTFHKVTRDDYFYSFHYKILIIVRVLMLLVAQLVGLMLTEQG